MMFLMKSQQVEFSIKSILRGITFSIAHLIEGYEYIQKKSSSEFIMRSESANSILQSDNK